MARPWARHKHTLVQHWNTALQTAQSAMLPAVSQSPVTSSRDRLSMDRNLAQACSRHRVVALRMFAAKQSVDQHPNWIPILQVAQLHAENMNLGVQAAEGGAAARQDLAKIQLLLEQQYRSSLVDVEARMKDELYQEMSGSQKEMVCFTRAWHDRLAVISPIILVGYLSAPPLPTSTTCPACIRTMHSRTTQLARLVL